MKTIIQAIKRIKYYSNLLDEGEEILNRYPESKDELLDFEEKYDEIDAYYTSVKYRKDLKLDADGLIPHEINTSILSQDCPYDFLMTFEKILNSIKK